MHESEIKGIKRTLITGIKRDNVSVSLSLSLSLSFFVNFIEKEFTSKLTVS